MLKLRRSIALVALCSVVLPFGCALNGTNTVSEVAIAWPSHWPQPAPALLPGSECPAIDGEYIQQGKLLNRTVDGAEKTQTESVSVSAWPLRVHPRNGDPPGQYPALLQKPATTADKAKFDDKLLITQSGPKLFTLTLLSGRRDFVDTIEFDLEKGDFNCEEGLIILRATDSGEHYGEGGAYRIFIDTRLTRTKDGALLHYQRNKTHSRRFFFFRDVRVNTTFSLFQRAQN